MFVLKSRECTFQLPAYKISRADVANAFVFQSVFGQMWGTSFDIPTKPVVSSKFTNNIPHRRQSQ